MLLRTGDSFSQIGQLVVGAAKYFTLVGFLDEPDRAREYLRNIDYRTAPSIGSDLFWLAYFEELLWDCGIWHDRSWLFGPTWDVAGLDVFLVPLLAVPQITHYILDGFIWRRKSNKEFAARIG